MRRYTQLEMEILKEAGYSVKEIARLDAAPHSRCEIYSKEDAKFWGLTGEEVVHHGNDYVVVWLG